MTTLQQAAKQALEALEIIDRAMPFPVGKQIITSLRTALEQLEPMVDCPRCGHVCSQRPWQGLTEEDWVEIGSRKNTVLDTFACGAAWAADQLEERNG